MFNLLRRLDGILVRMMLGMVRSRRKEGEIDCLGVKEVLCVKLWGLGNLVLIYPLLYKLKAKFPNARVTFVTFDINRGFLESNEAVSRVVYFKLTTNIFSIVDQSVGLMAAMRKQKVDLVVNFETYNNASAIFSYFTSAPVRVGINNKYERAFYTHAVQNDPSKHISEIFSDLLRQVGIDSPYQYHPFQFEDTDRKSAESVLSRHGVRQFICMHPGTSVNYTEKRCRERLLADLANLLLGHYDLTIVFTGGRGEADLVESIVAMIARKDRVINLAGRMTIGGLAELLRRSRLFISNDTGPVHLAASMGINVAVMYGPTTPKRFGPLNENRLVFYENYACGPCVGMDYLNRHCKYKSRCMEFSPKEVFNKIAEKFLDAQNN